MILSASDTAWLAGIFEGEGCICVFSQKGVQNLSVRLSVEMTDQDIVERFYDLVEVGTLRARVKPQKAHHKPKWIWSTTAKRDVETVLSTLYPWLGERRKLKACEGFYHLAKIRERV